MLYRTDLLHAGVINAACFRARATLVTCSCERLADIVLEVRAGSRFGTDWRQPIRLSEAKMVGDRPSQPSPTWLKPETP